MATRDPKTIENALKRYRRKIRRAPSKRNRKLGEFKFNKAPDNVKIDILDMINSKNVELGYVHVEKVRVYQQLREKRNEFYAYMCRVLLDKFLIETPDPKIDLIVDRQFAKKHRENFNQYLGWKITGLFDGLKVLNITIEILTKNRVCKPLILFAVRYIDATINMTLNISRWSKTNVLSCTKCGSSEPYPTRPRYTSIFGRR